MTLGDIKEDITNFVNEALRENFNQNSDGEYDASATDLDNEIQAVLDDLSKLDALVATDDTQTLSLGDTYLAYPTGFRSPVSIVLINSSGARQAPLEKLPGGQEQYEELRDNDSATGEPEWYSEFDDKFWLWRPPGGSFTSEIKYYINHPKGTLTNILFGDDFKQAILFGTTYFKALFSLRHRDIANWRPAYLEERAKMELEVPLQPHISKG